MRNILKFLTAVMVVMVLAITPTKATPQLDQVDEVVLTDCTQLNLCINPIKDVASVPIRSVVIDSKPIVYQAGLFAGLLPQGEENETTVDEADDEGGGLGDFITGNWVALLIGLLGLIEVIVRLTPTKKDDSVFNKIKAILDFILPNNQTTGGTFT